MRVKAKFKVIYSEEAMEFLNSLDIKAKRKIAYNIHKSMYVMDNDLFKKLDGTEIWEFRTLYRGIQYRLLSFWDTTDEALVIATHGFIKKARKTPLQEIRRAEEIRYIYFNSKK